MDPHGPRLQRWRRLLWLGACFGVPALLCLPATAEPDPTPQVVAQAQPAPQRREPVRKVKLGETELLVPAAYLERGADFGNKKHPAVPLSALLPDLRPRADGQGNCAPSQSACPDFAMVRVRALRTPLEKDFTKRYKAGPSAVGLVPGVHGLRQVPPHIALPADGRQFLAQPGGQWVWITCREFGRPAPKRTPRGVCRLAFDTADGLAVSVRFDQKKLGSWSAIHARAAELVASLKG